MMKSWIAGLGTKAIAAAILVAIIVGGVTVHSCSQRSQRSAQASQDGRSGAAAAEAAAQAIDTIGRTGEREDALDDRVDQTVKGIDNAEDLDGARRAALDGLCGMPALRDDPACSLQPPDPE